MKLQTIVVLGIILMTFLMTACTSMDVGVSDDVMEDGSVITPYQVVEDALANDLLADDDYVEIGEMI